MKRITLLLTLTLGFSALSVLGQSQGDQATQLKNPPARKDGEQIRKQDRRANERRPNRGDGPRQRRGDQFACPQMRGQASNFNGPQRRFAPGQGFDAQRGPAWNGPQAGPGQFGPRPEVCPHCHRPFDLGAVRGPQFRDRQGFGPRPGMAPMQRGLGPQARGPAFGPPLWAGRGGPNGDLRPAPRSPQTGAPMPERGVGPMRRGPGNSNNDEGRLDNRDQGARREGQALRERRPSDTEDR